MAQRFYFDTSVFGGIFDTEFEEETFQLFEKVKSGKIKCVHSNLTETELTNAPGKVKQFFKDLEHKHKEVIDVTPEAL
jgi:hypothetical protein